MSFVRCATMAAVARNSYVYTSKAIQARVSVQSVSYTTPALAFGRQVQLVLPSSTATARQQIRRLATSRSGAEERREYNRKVNMIMKDYSNARLLAQRGKLKPKREKPKLHFRTFWVLLLTLTGTFISVPLICKKVYTDPELRAQIYSWLNMKMPDESQKYMTRESMHNEVMRLEREMRERAARGEFSPENLAKMKRELISDDIPAAERFGWYDLDMAQDDDHDDAMDDEE